MLNRRITFSVSKMFDYEEVDIFFVLYLNRVISVIGTFTFVLGVVVLLTIWSLMPRWRTIHNYISIWQIGTSSLQQCCWCLELYYSTSTALHTFEYHCYIAAMCWSTCASVVAYIKLVLLYRGKIEKTFATICTATLFAVVSSAFSIASRFFVTNTKLLVPVVLVPFIAMINFCLYVRVCISVMSCFSVPMSDRNYKHVFALLNIAILTDTMTAVLWWIYIINLRKLFLSDFSFNDFIIYLGVLLLIRFKATPHLLFVLFSKTSRDQLKQMHTNKAYILITITSLCFILFSILIFAIIYSDILRP